jgi:hypothetical protein
MDIFDYTIHMVFVVFLVLVFFLFSHVVMFN